MCVGSNSIGCESTPMNVVDGDGDICIGNSIY